MIARDKKKHFAVGVGAGFLGGWIGLVLGGFIIPLSVILPIIFGVGKEVKDIKTTGFNLKDLIATTLGGLVSTTFWTIFVLSGINDYEGIF